MLACSCATVWRLVCVLASCFVPLSSHARLLFLAVSFFIPRLRHPTHVNMDKHAPFDPTNPTEPTAKPEEGVTLTPATVFFIAAAFVDWLKQKGGSDVQV